MSIWKKYSVGLQVNGRFASALPKDPKDIHNMLINRAPGKVPAGVLIPDGTKMPVMSIDQLEEVVAQEVGADEESTPGWATFPRDEIGLYYEDRSVRSHMKDCVSQILPYYPDIRNLRSKFVNRIYVATRRIRLLRNLSIITEIDGTETRFIQVMTRQGPRSSIKYIDYVNDPYLEFEMWVLGDGVITEDLLRTLFEYGGIHGMGQERSMQWGQYSLEKFQLAGEADPLPKAKIIKGE